MLKKHLVIPMCVMATAFVAVTPIHAQFWTNQIADPVVVQIGDGTTTASGIGYSTTLKHYLSGIANQPSAFSSATFASGALSTDRLVLSASATSEGNLTTSVDRSFAVLAGYDAANQTGAVNSTATNANRVVGYAALAPFVGLTGSAVTGNSNTQATAYNNNNIRSAVSLGGPSSDSWTGGTGQTTTTGGVRYANSNTQVTATPTNVRSVDIYNGQLFTSSASGANVGINTVGTGTPTGTGNTTTLLLPTGAGSSPYEYIAYNDLTASQVNLPVGNINRFYIADDRTSAAGGIQRWTWNGTAFILDYTLNDGGTLGARGLSGYLDANNHAVLYYTTQAGTQLREIIDTGTGTDLSFLLATADANTVFRGVALTVAVPEPTTYALMGMTGIVGAGVWFQRRRKAQTARFARI